MIFSNKYKANNLTNSPIPYIYECYIPFSMEKTCSICKSRDIKMEDESLSIYRCLDCGHFLTLIPRADQETYTQEYFAGPHKNWFKHPDTKFFDRIIKELDLMNASGKTLLDVGCGRGDLLRYAHSKGVKTKLCGIDISSNQEKGIEFLQGDFSTYKFERQFDFIVSTSVIEHIEDPSAFVRKIYDCLKPGGPVLLMTVNSKALMHDIARRFKSLGIRVVYDRLFNHHHLQHFNNDTLARLMKDTGFTIIEQTNHNYPLSAVDLPKSNPIMKCIYLLGVSFIFFFSNTFHSKLTPYLQTIICRKGFQTV
jgi:2-polyprenyl-3-methyl-5-hydroxy-6-metoxy-1,4-benzoquinol methylase